MIFKEKTSKTVFSTAITITDVPSKKTGKTANQSSESELIEETFRQLKISFPMLKKPTKAILSPELYFDGIWRTIDKAFFDTGGNYLEPKSKIQGLYTTGAHTGKADYAFTSMESAMTNALELVFLMEPEAKKQYKKERIWTVNEVISLTFLIILIIIFIIVFKYRKNIWKKMLAPSKI
jgi:hypothetical protein